MHAGAVGEAENDVFHVVGVGLGEGLVEGYEGCFGTFDGELLEVWVGSHHPFVECLRFGDEGEELLVLFGGVLEGCDAGFELVGEPMSDCGVL